ncbi:MAG TPA: low temperature requirement protein A [Solirubrobacteraceae bacterium]|nr:low temperature requirement protein A [Solirubrobacteraceae bacterium]
MPGRLRRSLRTTGTSEGDAVTNLELFFDLVYAFAFTQVTTLMTRERPPGSLLDGLIVLSLLWFSWCAFSWLANQARADRGILQGAVILAMVAVFIACLALPGAFRREPGALSGATVVVACYAVARVTHFGAYLVAAGDDGAVRRQVLVTMPASIVPTIALLFAGAALGQPWQRPVWAGAVLYDFAAVFLTANPNAGASDVGWAVRSAAHFAERYSLIVILALGESIVAIAVGLHDRPLSWKIALGALLAILIAVGIYLAYFGRLLTAMEDALARAQGRERARLGRDVFTYLHFPVIVGIIFAALGIEQAMSHLDGGRLGALGGWTLGGGVAVVLAGSAALALRSAGVRLRPRLFAAGLLVALCAPLALLPPLPAVGVVALVVLGSAAAEARPAMPAAR